MNCYYGMSIVGSSHVSRGIVCQDSHKVKRLMNGLVIAAIADGVGSSLHSDIASAIAVDTVVDYCESMLLKLTFKPSVNKLEEIIREAYTEAQLNIEKESAAMNNPITDFDTTLSMIIYDGKKIVYGHCGDGGIIGLTNQGDYVKITEPQKTEGIYVIPLRAGLDTWIIGNSGKEDDLCSVLLATDGVYDTFFPYLLRNQEVEVYVPLIRYFMDNNILRLSQANEEQIQEDRKKFLTSDACASITDDKTVVTVLNGEIYPDIKQEIYYAEPDWELLQTQWNQRAYPHLYEKEVTSQPNPKDRKQYGELSIGQDYTYDGHNTIVNQDNVDQPLQKNFQSKNKEKNTSSRQENSFLNNMEEIFEASREFVHDIINKIKK